jgi:hypothetical protein
MKKSTEEELAENLHETFCKDAHYGFGLETCLYRYEDSDGVNHQTYLKKAKRILDTFSEDEANKFIDLFKGE